MSYSSNQEEVQNHAHVEFVVIRPNSHRSGTSVASTGHQDHAADFSKAAKRLVQSRSTVRPDRTSSVERAADSRSLIEAGSGTFPPGSDLEIARNAPCRDDPPLERSSVHNPGQLQLAVGRGVTELSSNHKATSAKTGQVQSRHGVFGMPLTAPVLPGVLETEVPPQQIKTGTVQGKLSDTQTTAQVAADRISTTSDNNTRYADSLGKDEFVARSPSRLHAHLHQDNSQLEKELRAEKAAHKKKMERIENLESRLREMEAGHSERQAFSDHISGLKLAVWQKENQIKTLEARVEDTADLSNQVERLEDTQLQNKANINELNQEILVLRAEVNAANSQRLQHATTVRRLQHAAMYNSGTTTESYESKVGLREQNLEKDRLLRMQQRRVRNLEQELQYVEGLPEQYQHQSAKMDKILDKQLEMEEVMLQKIEELYDRLEEKQIDEQDLLDRLHARTNAEQEGLRTIERLEQKCHDLDGEKQGWKDTLSNKETELSEAHAEIKRLEKYFSDSRGPGWELRLQRRETPGSEELGSDNDDGGYQSRSEPRPSRSERRRRLQQTACLTDRVSEIVRETPHRDTADIPPKDMPPAMPRSVEGRLRGGETPMFLGSFSRKDLFARSSRREAGATQLRTSINIDSPRQKQSSGLLRVGQKTSGRRLPSEGMIESPSKRQRAGNAEANTASRRQSMVASVFPGSTPRKSVGLTTDGDGSVVIDAFDARRRILSSPLPAVVKDVLEQQVLVWNKKKDNWHRRNDSERLQCLNSLAEKKSTRWFRDDNGSPDTNHACTDCEGRGRLCAAMSRPNSLKILPLRNIGLQYVKEDARFWITSTNSQRP